MKILDQLARMIGVRDNQVDDALQDEGRARQAVQMSRRGFFAAGATMAAAPLVPKRVYSFLWETAVPIVDPPWFRSGSYLMTVAPAFFWMRDR